MRRVIGCLIVLVLALTQNWWKTPYTWLLDHLGHLERQAIIANNRDGVPPLGTGVMPVPEAYADVGEFKQDFVDMYPVTTAVFRLDLYRGFGPPFFKALPRFQRRFDWVLFQGYEPCWQHPVDRRHGKDPRTVLATPTAIPELLKWAGDNFDSSHADRVIVFTGGGTCMWLSGVHEFMNMSALRKYFKLIFWETKDIDMQGVFTVPSGLVDYYLRQPGVVESAGKAIKGAAIDVSSKPRNALLSFGMFGGPLLNNSDVDASPAWPNTSAAIEELSKIHSKGLVAARVSRIQALRWFATEAAKEANVERRRFSPNEWWGELSKYRFLLSPLGDQIQCTKTFEALLVLTIPVVQRGPYPAHDDLVRMGFPLVLVDEWSELTRENFHKWWHQLSPRLDSFRRNCLTGDGFWKLSTGQISVCH